MNLKNMTRTQRRMMGKHGLSFKTRCQLNIHVRQMRREQLRKDMNSLRAVLGLYILIGGTAGMAALAGLIG